MNLDFILKVDCNTCQSVEFKLCCLYMGLSRMLNDGDGQDLAAEAVCVNESESNLVDLLATFYIPLLVTIQPFF